MTEHTKEDGHGAVRPAAQAGVSTRRDIHISEQGQHTAPSGPTRIATWRPIPGKTIPKVAFIPNKEQLLLINQLKEYTESNLMIESNHDYYIWEKKFLDRKDTYSRYMRAADWKMDNAKKRIKDTLEWRRSYKPDLISPEEIKVEAEGGKVVVNGFDRDGRPIVWLRPSRENTKPSPRRIRHLIFQLERAIDLMPDGVETLALVVDYKGATSSNNPSMKTVKQVIHILQNHYVERLGKGIVVNVPYYLQAFFSMIKPLLDPKTKAKVEFNPNLGNLIPNKQLDSEFGGDYNYIYDVNVYLIALCHFCGIKNDGTREDIIPKDLPSIKPEEIQRTLTQQTGNTAEEEAEFARREAEAQERQDEEARLFAEKGRQLEFKDDDDEEEDHGDEVATTLDPTTSAKQVQDGIAIPNAKHRTGTHESTLPEGVIAAAAAASIAAATKASGHNGNTSQTVQRDVNLPTKNDTATPSIAREGREASSGKLVEDSTSTQSTAVQSSSKDAASTKDTVKPKDNTPVEPTDLHPTPAVGATKPVVASDATQPAAKPSSQPATATGATQQVSASDAPQPAARPSTPEPKAPTEPTNSVKPPAAAQTAKQPTRKRGGWKLFSSKRGLDKEGNPTTHKHKHISKAFCMHKGAVDPSKSQANIPVEKSAPAVEDGIAGTTPTTNNNRIKIAPEATEGREERTYNNAPLATNATFGPDAYHTAMEAYPTSSSGQEGEGDYFTNMRKIPTVKPTNVKEEEKDKAQMVKRPTEIMNRLHEGGTGDLVLAFEVKQPPLEEGADGNAEAEQSGDGVKTDGDARAKTAKDV